MGYADETKEEDRSRQSRRRGGGSRCAVAYLLDVCPSSTGSENGAALQLYAFHSFAVQDYWLLLAVVETLVAIPSTQHEANHSWQPIAHRHQHGSV